MFIRKGHMNLYELLLLEFFLKDGVLVAVELA